MPPTAKKYSSGGATFTPRLTPRPSSDKFPNTMDLLWNIVIPYVRAPILCVLFVHFAYPYLFMPALNYCMGQPMIWKNDKSGEQDRIFYTLLFVVVKFSVWILVNGFFYIIEKNGWFIEYKLDRKAVQLPSKKLIMENIRDVFIGMFLTGPPLVYYVLYPVQKYLGMPASNAPLPENKEMFYIFVFCYVLNDWGFYWSHRLLHAAPIYKYIHKQHHMYTGTVSCKLHIYIYIIYVILTTYSSFF